MDISLQLIWMRYVAQLNCSNILYLDEFLSECSKNIPIKNSIVAFVVLVKCLKVHLSNQELNLKKLYLDMQYSEISIRKQIYILESFGWVIIEVSAKDRRVKLLKPTDKFLRHCNQILYNSSTIKSLITIY